VNLKARKSRIKGTGHAVPKKVLTNFDLEKMVETSDEWITTRTGIKQRHQALEKEYLSPFASEAARNALEAAHLEPGNVELIIVCSVTPDQPIPATACFVQQQLGASQAFAFDIQAGCSGFLYGLGVADGFIRSGQVKNALVIGAELLTKYLDWEDRSTCVIFGDGAGAVVLEATEEEDRGILASQLHSDGSQADLISMPGGGTKHPYNEETIRQNLNKIRMRGNETFKIAVRRLETVALETLAAAQIHPDDVDLFIPHQANIRIIDAVAKRLGFPKEKILVNIQNYGNTSSASIPIALDEWVRSNGLKEGSTVLMVAFGAGLTWAGTVLKW